MAHIARIVVPGCPHHVTQRGNRRERVFFEDRDWLAESCRKFGVSVWALPDAQPRASHSDPPHRPG